jgi:diaminopimelate decarboxylase
MLPAVLSPTATQRALVPRAIAHLSDEQPCALFFDMDAFRSNLLSIKASFPPSTVHAIAMKANPLAACLLVVKELGMACEVASPGELEHALRLGFAPEKIVLDSPAKTRRDIFTALSKGVQLNADSFEELERIDTLLVERFGGGGRLGTGHCKSRIGLRVNPQHGEGRIATSATAAPTSKFGVPLTEAKIAVLECYKRYGWLTGVHCHVGSQGCDVELLLEGARAVLLLAEEINQHVGCPQVEQLDIGGGMPVDYGSDSDTDVPDRVTPTRYVAALRERLPELFNAARFRIVTEFGRYISAKCGLVVSTVEYVKSAGGRRIAVVHCGADLFLRTVYQPASWPHRVSAWTAAGDFLDPAAGTDTWDVVGPLCFRGDIVAQGVQLPSQLRSGCAVCVHDAGAYTLSMFSKYNSRQAPPVFGFGDGGNTIVQISRGESFDEALQMWRQP